jgi:hypothetical protein
MVNVIMHKVCPLHNPVPWLHCCHGRGRCRVVATTVIIVIISLSSSRSSCCRRCHRRGHGHGCGRHRGVVAAAVVRLWSELLSWWSSRCRHGGRLAVVVVVITLLLLSPLRSSSWSLHCHGHRAVVIAVAVVVVIMLSPLSCCHHGHVVIVLSLLSVSSSSSASGSTVAAHRLHPSAQCQQLNISSSMSAAHHLHPLLNSSCLSSVSICSVSASVVIHPGGLSVTPLGILILPNLEPLLQWRAMARNLAHRGCLWCGGSR